MTDVLTPRRLRPTDLGRLASIGLRTRKLRAALSALGIAIGVAAIVAVVGLSSSSQAGLLAEIDKLGTNLLTVTNGRTVAGDTAELPTAAPGMIARIGPVTAVQYTGRVGGVNAYRSPLIPAVNTNALSVQAASLDLPATVGTTVTRGRYLNPATAREPVAVLGAAAAARLGVDRLYPGERIWVGPTSRTGMWFYLTGILHPAVLTPEVDTAILIGFPAAQTYLGFDGHPSAIYLRAATDQVNPVHALLAVTANPEHPNQVTVSRPSDALVARAAAKSALNGLVPRLGRRVPARRRRRCRQHHDHLRAGETLRDRATPGAGRRQRSHPRPVPVRSHAAGHPRRRRWRRGWSRRYRRLRAYQTLVHRHPNARLGRRAGRRPAHRRPCRPPPRVAGGADVTHPSPLDRISAWRYRQLWSLLTGVGSGGVRYMGKIRTYAVVRPVRSGGLLCPGSGWEALTMVES